jgi:hypothetical protein
LFSNHQWPPLCAPTTNKQQKAINKKNALDALVDKRLDGRRAAVAKRARDRPAPAHKQPVVQPVLEATQVDQPKAAEQRVPPPVDLVPLLALHHGLRKHVGRARLDHRRRRANRERAALRGGVVSAAGRHDGRLDALEERARRHCVLAAAAVCFGGCLLPCCCLH